MWIMEFPPMAQDLNMARGVERSYFVSRANVGRWFIHSASIVVVLASSPLNICILQHGFVAWLLGGESSVIWDAFYIHHHMLLDSSVVCSCVTVDWSAACCTSFKYLDYVAHVTCVCMAWKSGNFIGRNCPNTHNILTKWATWNFGRNQNYLILSEVCWRLHQVGCQLDSSMGWMVMW